MTGPGARTHDGLGLAALVRAGELEPADLLARTRADVETRDPALGAVVHRFFGIGEAAIDAGLPDGPFRGVPLLVKDAGLAMAGTPLTSGSRFFEGQVCEADDTLAKRLKVAGFVPAGRSKTPEFSLSFTTEPEAFGPVHNPWALGRSAGGSSGGAAAAVAAGLVAVAHATDGAGSIRVPAAHCGVFGFKPSRIRNPLGPRVAEGNAGMGTPHAVTRSVRDSAALLDATAGADAGDPYAVEAPVRQFLDEASADPPPLRIGIVETSTLAAVAPDCRVALDGAASLCEALGHRVERAAFGHDEEELMRAWRIVGGVGIAATIGAALATRQSRFSPAHIEAVDIEWIMEGRRWSGVDYLAAVNVLHRAGRAMGACFARFDVLLSPVTAVVAPPLGALAGRGRSLDAFFDAFWAHAPFTAVFNASGGPAMSVPLHWTEPLAGASRGLPVGVQFGADRGRDGLMFALAGQLERARPWAGRWPGAPAG